MNPDDIEAIAAYARNIAGSSGIDGNAGARLALLEAYVSIGGDKLASHLIDIEIAGPNDHEELIGCYVGLISDATKMRNEMDEIIAQMDDPEEDRHIATHRHFGGKL